MGKHLLPPLDLKKTVSHEARGKKYEIKIYQKDDEYLIIIVKEDRSIIPFMGLTQEDLSDAAAQKTLNMIEEIISIAKDDIDRNDFKNFD